MNWPRFSTILTKTYGPEQSWFEYIMFVEGLGSSKLRSHPLIACTHKLSLVYADDAVLCGGDAFERLQSSGRDCSQRLQVVSRDVRVSVPVEHNSTC